VEAVGVLAHGTLPHLVAAVVVVLSPQALPFQKVKTIRLRLGLVRLDKIPLMLMETGVAIPAHLVLLQMVVAVVNALVEINI
jgi:hypothetical protein